MYINIADNKEIHFLFIFIYKLYHQIEVDPYFFIHRWNIHTNYDRGIKQNKIFRYDNTINKI